MLNNHWKFHKKYIRNLFLKIGTLIDALPILGASKNVFLLIIGPLAASNLFVTIITKPIKIPITNPANAKKHPNIKTKKIQILLVWI